MRRPRFIITYAVPADAGNLKPWELYLGRPRSGKLVLGLLGFTVIAVPITYIVGRLGYLIPSWWAETLMVAVFGTIASLAIAASAYSLFATVVLLSPVLYLAVTDVLVDLGVVFWCFTGVTTVLGGVLTMRAGRVWKLYRQNRR